MYKKQLSAQEALQKLKHFCSYQERCHQDVTNKLYDLGVWKKEHDGIISTLIEEGYLNEERFAIQFAGGKFRMKQWGRIKITRELKMRQISAYCIKKALQEIPDDDYQNTARKLFDTKKQSLRQEKNIFIKKRKIQDFLLAKGYETSLIQEFFNEI